MIAVINGSWSAIIVHGDPLMSDLTWPPCTADCSTMTKPIQCLGKSWSNRTYLGWEMDRFAENWAENYRKLFNSPSWSAWNWMMVRCSGISMDQVVERNYYRGPVHPGNLRANLNQARHKAHFPRHPAWAWEPQQVQLEQALEFSLQQTIISLGI